MDEYYRLQKTLFLVSFAIASIVFASIWLCYSLATALNYLLGACVGVLYLRRLAKDIEGLGGGSRLGFGTGRLALFMGVIVAASQLHDLRILPIFLGFLTYKAAIIAYVMQTTLFPRQP